MLSLVSGWVGLLRYKAMHSIKEAPSKYSTIVCMCAETADNHSYTHKCKPSISMLTAAVQPSPSERREIDILLLFVVLQKEAETEEHFIKNTTRIYRAAAGGAVRRSHPCTQDSV